MKRLQDDELQARIHNFLQRKLEEFPELADGENPAPRSVVNRQPKTRIYQAKMHWGTKPV